MTGGTSRAGTSYPSGAPELTPVLVGFVLIDLWFYVLYLYLTLSNNSTHKS